jgi:hypothetical protein
VKVIFLDIDGVLNCENGYVNGFCKYTDLIVDGDEKDHYQQFYPPSKKLLNKLIEETNAKVVISSTWRIDGIEFMERVWESEGMSGEIIGLTPNFRNNNLGITIPRGVEIKNWLDKKGFRRINWSKDEQQKYQNESDIENYIIIDDDSDMLYAQREHFVHVKPSPRNKEGFNQENYDRAYGILTKNLIDLYYDKDNL